MKGAFASLALLGAAASLAAAGDGGQGAKFKVATKKADDSVEIQLDKDRVVFAVKSPSGIGQAVITRTEGKWPAVVLRLHLKGLESFRVSNGMVTLDAAVSLQDGKPKVRQWKDGKEDAPLDEKSPFW